MKGFFNAINFFVKAPKNVFAALENWLQISRKICSCFRSLLCLLTFLWD